MCKILKEKKSARNVGWRFRSGISNDVSWSTEIGLNKYALIFYKIHSTVDLFKAPYIDVHKII